MYQVYYRVQRRPGAAPAHALSDSQILTCVATLSNNAMELGALSMLHRSG